MLWFTFWLAKRTHAAAAALAFAWLTPGCGSGHAGAAAEVSQMQSDDHALDRADANSVADAAADATVDDDAPQAADSPGTADTTPNDDAPQPEDFSALADATWADDAPQSADSSTAGIGDIMLPFCDDAADDFVADAADAAKVGQENDPCDDGDNCTQNDKVKNGLCVGVLINCSDGNQCTLDGCESDGGCKHATAWLKCDDGNACTHGDHCSDGTCSGEPTKCGKCGAGPCNPATGCTPTEADGTVCGSQPGDPCQLPDVCKGGACVAGPSKTCKAPGPCTVAYCTGEGYCTVAESKGSCDDGDPCTVDGPCYGGCAGATPNKCDDANPCTTDACAAAVGCTHLPQSATPCADGDTCTANDTCVNGVCKGTVTGNCDDGNPCTTDECAGKGCKTTILPDGQQCAPSGVCQAGKCVSVKCITDAGCPNGCECKGYACQWPQWSKDGKLPFFPKHRLGYHGFLDEYWSNDIFDSKKDAAVWTRYKPTGQELGTFAQPTFGGEPLVSIGDMDGDTDTPRWFMAGCSANACAVGGYASPGGPQLWSQAVVPGDPQAAWGGVFVHAGKVWAVANQPKNGAPSVMLAFDRQCGQLLAQYKIMETLQNLRGARWYDGQLYTYEAATASSGSISVFKASGATFVFDYGKNGDYEFNQSMVVRGNRFCFSSFGASQCFAMKTQCM